MMLPMVAIKYKLLIMTMIISATVTLTSCTTMSIAVKKRKLEVKTQMSKTIWLDPIFEKTVYLQIKNTSDKDLPELTPLIIKAIADKGYHVKNNPNAAYYWIQVNVLKADKMNLQNSDHFLLTGYEDNTYHQDHIKTTSTVNNNIYTTILGTIIAVLVNLTSGIFNLAADTLIEDVNFSMITDLQISVINNEHNLNSNNHHVITNNIISNDRLITSKAINRDKYQTRIVSNANKVNLTFDIARIELEKQLAKSIANIL